MYSKHNTHNYFQYAITVSLKQEQIKRDPQSIKKIYSFINRYKWKDKKVPSHR